MNATLCFFVAPRYWTDPAELSACYARMREAWQHISPDIHLIKSEEEVDALLASAAPKDILVAVPMSGAVQPWILKASAPYKAVCFYPGYIEGNFPSDIALKMLTLNAAPAVMDVYSVVKRSREHVFLCLNEQTLLETLRAVNAVFKLQKSKLILIGEIEPWVISATRNLEKYTNHLGVTIEKVPQAEMVKAYHDTTAEEARELFEQWKGGAARIDEPTEEDILNASRFNAGLLKLMRAHNADGVAIACFNLLFELGTTACLAVSYINNHTPYIAACEGDVDSAVTMLLMKQLTADKLWMANPNLQNDGTVNFVHCSAPTDVGGAPCPCILRNHHESGIGVSTQVTFPDDIPLTACRISDEASKITIQHGIGRQGAYEPSCRTQLRVTFDSLEKYLDTALGCHQVFAFEDITAPLRTSAKMLGLEVL